MDSFTVPIIISIAAYVIAAFIPKQIQRNIPPITQKLGYLVAAVVLALALIVNSSVLWIVLGVLYSLLTVCSFIKVQDWGSTEQNLFMAGWDFLLAYCCFIQL